MYPYVVCSLVVITIYVRIDGWLIEKKITGDLLSNIGKCCVVIKRGHIFPIPFWVNFIHQSQYYKNAKILDFMKIEGAVTAMISESPFKITINLFGISV